MAIAYFVKTFRKGIYFQSPGVGVGMYSAASRCIPSWWSVYFFRAPCQDLGIPVIELRTFWDFGADDDACDICWTRYIILYVFVAGLNKPCSEKFAQETSFKKISGSMFIRRYYSGE